MGLEVAALTLGAGALGYGIYQGEQQAKLQRQGLRQQRQAEKTAEVRAVSEARRGEMADAAARRKAPNLDVLLGGEPAKPGPSGMNADKLLLGRPSLLGL